jgi:hypothetical protein
MKQQRKVWANISSQDLVENMDGADVSAVTGLFESSSCPSDPFSLHHTRYSNHLPQQTSYNP